MQPEGCSFCKRLGSLPIFSHAADDLKTFRMITSQLYINGSVKQADICRAFGVSRISVKRSVKLYREKGAAGFFEPPRRRGPAVLTPEVLKKVQTMLDNEHTLFEIANELNLKADTLRKAISSGKLHKPQKKLLLTEPLAATSKSERSRGDASAPIGGWEQPIFLDALKQACLNKGLLRRSFLYALMCPTVECCLLCRRC
jgi:transposase